MPFPNDTTSLPTNMQGTTLLADVTDDHGLNHRQLGSIINALPTTFGTTGGTNILKYVASSGQFAMGINTGGTVLQTMIGTLNNSVLGTPAITGGTITNGVVNTATIGTPSITGGTMASGVFNGGTLGTPTITGGVSLSSNGSITQTSTADHITLTPGASKLVKFAVLEQDGTTNTYQNKAVILTGWGFITGDGTNTGYTKSVTFGGTFTTQPIVVTGLIGYKDSADPTAIGDFPSGQYVASYGVFANGIGTTGFTACFSFFQALASGRRFGFTWTAIGVM